MDMVVRPSGMGSRSVGAMDSSQCRQPIVPDKLTAAMDMEGFMGTQSSRQTQILALADKGRLRRRWNMPPAPPVSWILRTS